MQDKKLLIIIGRSCSGKDRFANNHIDRHHIDIGAIVRWITSTQERIQNPSLDQQIIEELDRIFIDNLEQRFIITGIRQLSILKFLLYGKYSKDLSIIHLNVDEKELKRRFLSRAAEKDQNITFEETIQRDHKLGLGEVEEWIKRNQNLVVTINNN